MTDAEPDPPEDPWLTLAEIAEELRLSPVTIRSWISKGRLRAKRAGQRKWLVRRSDLDRMLEQDDGPAPSPTPPPSLPAEQAEMPDELLAQITEDAAEHERTDREQWFAMASYEWEIALEQSQMAPPDARFPSRIRHIAEAASRRAAVIRDCMNDPTFCWMPIPDSQGMTLSYELRPGGNRPGPKDAWERFDRVATRLGAAMKGSSAGVVATALSDLARAMTDVADAIEKRPPREPRRDDESGLDGSERHIGGAE